MRHLQQTLVYSQRAEDIQTVGAALDLLAHKQVAEAIELLMLYRNRLQDMQTPRVVDYDPRKAQLEAGR